MTQCKKILVYYPDIRICYACLFIKTLTSYPNCSCVFLCHQSGIQFLCLFSLVLLFLLLLIMLLLILKLTRNTLHKDIQINNYYNHSLTYQQQQKRNFNINKILIRRYCCRNNLIELTYLLLGECQQDILHITFQLKCQSLEGSDGWDLRRKSGYISFLPHQTKEPCTDYL